MSQEIVVITTKLNPREQRAYEAAVENDLPRVGPELQAKMFGLYLSGSSCEEIMKYQQGLTLGQIVRCKVEFEWDRQLEEYRAKLAENAKERLLQSQYEQFEFLTLLISATHKYYKDKIKKFLLSGDERDLQGVPISLQNYKHYLEMFQKVTGQEVKKVEVNTNQTVTVKGAISPDKAAKLLELLDEDGDVDVE